MKKVEYNIITGQVTEENLTAEEIARLDALKVQAPAEIVALREQAAAKQAAKAAVLAKLGLTEEEVATLL